MSTAPLPRTPHRRASALRPWLHSLWLGGLLVGCGGGADEPPAAMASTATAEPMRQALATTTPSASSELPSLPAELQARPAAAACAALRSGQYRVVFFDNSGSTSRYTVDLMTLDATTLRLSGSDGAVDTLVPVATCRFVSASGGAQLLVSPAGVIALRFDITSGRPRVGLAFPNQSHGVASLAGSWNTLGQEQGSGSSATRYSLRAGSLTLDSTGRVTAGQACPGVRNCSMLPTTPASRLSSDGHGGFNFSNGPAGRSDRVFAYRAGNGDLMAVQLAGGGSYALWTMARTAAAPTVGTQSRLWNLGIGSGLLSTGEPFESDLTVLSLDNAAAPSGYGRRAYTGINGATYSESMRLNQPRSGYLQRLAAPATATDGTTVNVREFTAMPLRGMGLSAVALPATSSQPEQMTLSLAQAGTVWLPGGLLNRAAAPNCAALRAGPQRLVFAVPDAADQTGVLTLNLPSMQMRRADGSVATTLRATGTCRFASLDGGLDLVVSQAGVGMLSFTSGDGGKRLALMWPEQAHTQASLAGAWQALSWNTDDTAPAFSASLLVLNLGADGNTSDFSLCKPLTRCQSVPSGLVRVLRNPTAGGFDVRDSGSNSTFSRLFRYRAGNGDDMLVSIDSDGSLGLWTRQRSNLLPAVGTRSSSWEASLGVRLTVAEANGFSSSSNVIQSVNSAGGSLVRLRTMPSGATVAETLSLNRPRAGINQRGAATVKASDGSTVQVRAFDALQLRGMGVSALSFPTLSLFMVSVGQP